MAQQEIVVDIDSNGGVKIEGVGFAGPECKQATAALEEALGTVTETVKKPEFTRTRAAVRKVGA